MLLPCILGEGLDAVARGVSDLENEGLDVRGASEFPGVDLRL